jgi:hypothetical protein
MVIALAVGSALVAATFGLLHGPWARRSPGRLGACAEGSAWLLRTRRRIFLPIVEEFPADEPPTDRAVEALPTEGPPGALIGATSEPPATGERPESREESFLFLWLPSSS